jgi:DNA recombination-dependent growth factor C
MRIECSRWLLEHAVCGPFSPGDACKLQSPDGQSAARFSGADLYGDEVRSCLDAGHVVEQIQLDHNSQMTFTLADPWRLKSIHYGDMLLNQVEPDLENEIDAFLADMYVQIGALRELFKDIGASLGGWAEQRQLPLEAV